MENKIILTEKFRKALVCAAELHNSQKRKGTQIPYIAHLLAVTSIVLENGGNENEAIGALLHDAVEDQGNKITLDDIRVEYGDEVADIVLDCSDSWEEEKPPWEERKQIYLKNLPNKSPSSLLVSLADKMHNISSMVNDYKVHGEEIWNRFNAPKDRILWYYKELAKIFKENYQGHLADDFDNTVETLCSLIEESK